MKIIDICFNIKNLLLKVISYFLKKFINYDHQPSDFNHTSKFYLSYYFILIEIIYFMN